MQPLKLVVPAGANQRLDVFLSAAAGLSRREARERIAGGAVRVNGRTARKGDRVQPGDAVEVMAIRAAALAPQGDLPVRVLFEDADLVVLDKPSGLASVALSATSRDTVANFLTARYGGRDARDLEGGLVQRLDTSTSGVMIAARSEAARLDLRRQLRGRSVEKLYLAVVRGDCAAAGSIAEPIGDPPRRARRVAVRRQLPRIARSRARPAQTHYRPLRRFAVATLLEVRIATGVRHQIRVHLASIGHPVLGDPLYAADRALAAPRLLLHAWQVRFRHPATHRMLTVRAPLPPDFRLVVGRLRRGTATH